MTVRGHHSYFSAFVLFYINAIQAITSFVGRYGKNRPLDHFPDCRCWYTRQTLAIEFWKLGNLFGIHADDLKNRLAATDFHPFIFQPFYLNLIVGYLTNDLVKLLGANGDRSFFNDITLN